jgi:outer membrane protein OmpA-like peptidoglycan-associated protein
MFKLIIIINVLFSILIFAQSERDELFNEVEIILDKAKVDNADILCATNYNLAIESYNSAKEMNSHKESPIKIREELEESITYLTKMNNNIEEKVQLFANTISIRNSAIDSGADKNATYFWELGEKKLSESLELYNDESPKIAVINLKDVDGYYSTAKLYSNKYNTLVNNSESIVLANKRLAYLLAPNSFSESNEMMYETLEKISSGKKLSEINKSIADTELMFELSAINAMKYSDEYPEVLASRKDAKTVDAEKYTLEVWQEGEELLKESADAFENEDFDKANEYAMEAKDNYDIAKHTSIKDYFLSDARNEIDLAVDEGAEEHAPITLKKSQDYLSEVSSLIESDSYSLLDIKNISLNSFKSAKNARYITEISKRMEPGEQSWEEIILTQQGEELLPIQEPIKVEAKSETNWINLSSDIEEYLKDDATVIDKDEVIILRLDKVNFATMLTQLNDEAKASLNRIAEAIKQYPNNEATVVCYTDNIGTRSANKALSQKRAEVVYNYLKKRNSSTELFVDGRGEENPIASNNNAEGRKQNRRVEIEIKK